MSARNSRHCPVFGCRHVLREPYLVCRDHWLLVPEVLRLRLWRLYEVAPGSRQHRALMADIIIGLNQMETGAIPSSFITAKEAE